MDEDRLRRWLAIGAALSFGVAFIGALGEALDWWNDLGEALISIGGFAGLLLTLSTTVLGASRRQVGRLEAAVRAGLEATNQRLDDSNTKLDSVGDKLDTANTKLDSVGDKLDRSLEKHDATNARLDRIADILGEIRDRL